MPVVTFTVTTQALIKRLELDEITHFVPIGLNGGIGNATLASGYGGVVRLYLQGQRGQTGKLKVTQKVGGQQVTLAERTITITSDTGQAITFLPFRVQ